MIQLENLTKTFKVLNRKEGLRGAVMDLFSRDYRYVTAVDDVSIQIDEGEIIGYVGPNGAGKSTTIKMMTGILQPSSGKIIIDGRQPYQNRREHMRNIGVVFGQRSQLWWSLPVRESFKVLKEMYLVDDDTYARNLKLFESLVDIESLYGKPVRQMSLGQRMLCEVVAAFLHDPKVVFLDEPTIGLDVAVKESIRDLIRHLNEEKNTTIILTSHDTKDIETLCRRVAIIDKGKLIFDNDIDSLKQMFGKYRRIHLTLDTEEAYSHREKYLSDLLKEFYTSEQVCIVNTENEKTILEVDEEKVRVKEVLPILLDNLPIQDLGIEDVSMEEVIKKIYAGGVADVQTV